jgi:hypothetical protein
MATSMGSLKPDVPLIYERVGPVVYAREFGSTERYVVGYEVNQENKILGIPQSRVARILAIQQMTEADPGMRELWEQLEILYNLKNTNE